MTSSNTSAAARIAFATLLASAVFGAASTGCSGSGGGHTALAQASDDPPMPSREEGNAPKPPPVGGPADTSELTDALGVFVSPNGEATATGTHDHPLASIQAGIDLAKGRGKRVYVCTGSFHEALTVADSISIIGGLDCTDNEWRVGAAHTRIDAPSSPAIRAAAITSATRIEGLDVFAPKATVASASSIALLADHASALVVASTKLVAASAGAGADGTEGIQLVSGPFNSGPATTAAACAPNTTCPYLAANLLYTKPLGAHGGTNACTGAPGHAAESGGDGGSGGVWQAANDVVGWRFDPYRGASANAADPGVLRSSSNGADGTMGTNAAPFGTLSADGYVPANGAPGADGAPGSGGAGGSGRIPTPDYDPNTSGSVRGVWRGFGGAGGGPGGCPGLAGTPGKGGGASIAALLVESAVTFDGAQLQSSDGGSGGRGSFGSAPTDGGEGGPNVYYALMAGKSGGRGGAAGISGNGANGPSAGIAYVGSKPIMDPTTKITPGTPAPEIPARSRTTLDITKTIPATPAGISQDVLAL